MFLIYYMIVVSPVPDTERQPIALTSHNTFQHIIDSRQNQDISSAAYVCYDNLALQQEEQAA